MPFAADDAFNLDISVFGGLVTDIEASNLPPGASPDCQDVFFLPGSVFTRPALSRELSTPLTGAPAVMSLADFPLAAGGFRTAMLDANGLMWSNNPSGGSTVQTDTVTKGVSFASCNAFNKQFYAFYSPVLAAAFSPNPFMGVDEPRYDNGNGILRRVTSDAPAAAPFFTNLTFPPFSLSPTAVTGTLTVTAVATSGQTVTVIPGSGGSKGPVFIGDGSPGFIGGGVVFTPPRTVTTWTEFIFTCSTAVPANWVGQIVAVSGLTGTNAQYAIGNFTVIAVSGNTFTVPVSLSFTISLSAQSGTANLGGGTGNYLIRKGNIVTAYVGTTLPAGIQNGFWVSLQTSTGAQLNGPNWTINSAVRDATGLVTVVINAQLTNLPTGASLYFSNLALSASGTVAVVQNSPSVAWVSGNQFDATWVGQNITINGVTYTISFATATALTLTSNITSASATYSYTASITYITAGYQTVYQVLATTSTTTTFTFQTLSSVIFSLTGGTVYLSWSPLGGVFGNAAQIINVGDDTTNGFFIQWFQLGPDMTFTGGTAPIAQLVAQITPGQRQATVHFINVDGAETAPAQVVLVSSTGGSSYLQASQIPIGPPGTVARAIDFTPAGGSDFYSISPATVPAQAGTGPQVTIGTLISDNTTVQTVLDFSDTQLTAGEQINVTGNDLFNQVVLAPCLGVIAYNSRLYWWGEINNLKNLLNMSFDGGYNPAQSVVSATNGSPNITLSSGASFNTNWPAGTQVSIGGTIYAIASVTSGSALVLATNFAGTTATYGFYALSPLGLEPPGWSTASGDGAGSLVFGANPDQGFAYKMPGGFNSMLTQGAFQDASGGPILQPQTTYIFRMKAIFSGSPTTGNFIAELFSPSLGSLATATVALSAIPANWGWVNATFSAATPAAIPTDAVLRIYLNGTSSGATVQIDETEMINGLQPVLNNQARVSYVANEFGYDALTGVLGLDTSDSITGAFRQRNYLYFLTDEDLFQSQSTSNTEPNNFPVSLYAKRCGCSGPNAVDSSVSIAWWAGRYGVREFSGNPDARKLSQYIDPNWETMNWNAQSLIWLRNDEVNRQLLIGVPLGSASTPSKIFAMNYRLADATYDVPDPIHVSMYNGKMLATDMGQKWTPWNVTANGATMCMRSTSQGMVREIVFAGGNGQAPGSGTNFGEIYSLNFNKLSDDDYGQINSYYTTYFWFSHDMEQNPVLQSHRKLFTFMALHLTGQGAVTVTPYIDALSNGVTAPPAITLDSSDPGFDLEFPLNVTGERMAVKVSAAPANGSVSVVNGSPNVNWMSGNLFSAGWAGQTIVINGVSYTVQSATAKSLVLTTNVTSATGTYGYVEDGTNSYFKLTHFVLAGRQDRLMPVRGTVI